MFSTAMLRAPAQAKQERAVDAKKPAPEKPAARGRSRAFSYAMLAIGAGAFAFAQLAPIFMASPFKVALCMIPGSLWAIASVGGFLALSFLMEEEEPEQKKA